ncbi:MAG TPA: nucleotidyltransferase domain-containing protein [Candidatus Deferrimicrobium sp.]|nr:nucleotidyltransferase domain-containing protein [Candidatus Deferrimicrobium sp.]
MRQFERKVHSENTINLTPELIRERCLSIFSEFSLVYLFGSLAKRRLTPLSDIDIGILINKKCDFFNLQIELIGKFMDVLHEEVDVVILDTAPPLLKFEVIKGILLFQRDDKTRIEFEVKVRNEYYDTQYLRQVQSKYLFERIGEI